MSGTWSTFRFEQPWWLLLLLTLPLMVWLYQRRRPPMAQLRFSSLAPLIGLPPGWRVRMRPLLLLLRMAGLVMLVLALAGPQAGRGRTRQTSEGIDIMVALDISGSMRVTDDPQGKAPNRLEEARGVIRNFIQGRSSDAIGLVVFADEPHTVAPRTLDYAILDHFLAEVEMDQESRTTAIGMALAQATNRLRDSEARSRIIILVTDGENNAGQIDPVTAAGLAKSLGIKIYSVGIGSPEGGYLVVSHPIFGSQTRAVQTVLDEPTLRTVAETTDGQYFRASHPGAMEEIFKTIDQLEKHEIERIEYTQYQALFPWALLAGLLLLSGEWALGATVLRRLP